jgi:hypothetical protein
MFEAHYVRQKSAGLFRPPEECVELWPIPPITAPTAQEARDKALLLLEIADSGTQEELFEQRPCPMPKRMQTIHSPTHKASALIIKHAESRYEVRYFGDLVGCDWETGWRLGVPDEKREDWPPGFMMYTIADDLPSAEQIAVVELERIVSKGEIKPRPSNEPPPY